MMLSLLFLLSATDCKTVLLQKQDPAPCAGYLVGPDAAKQAFDIVENLYPKMLEKSSALEHKISLLSEELKVDDNLVASLKQEVVIYKKDVAELMEFSRKSILESDKQLKLQTVIVVVAVGVTIVLTIGVVLAVGYLAQGFTR